jgi:hypothetical protein
VAHQQHAPDLVSVGMIVGTKIASYLSVRSICFVLDKSISSQMGKPSLVQQHLGPNEKEIGPQSSLEPRVTALVVRSNHVSANYHF